DPAASDQLGEPSREIAGDEIAGSGRADPARDQRQWRRPGRSTAECGAHGLLVIQKAQKIFAPLADDDAAALYIRVRVKPVELAGDLRLQIAGEGRDPDAALVLLSP